MLSCPSAMTVAFTCDDHYLFIENANSNLYGVVSFCCFRWIDILDLLIIALYTLIFLLHFL